MKKIFVFLITFFISGCFSISLTKNEVSREDIEEQFDKTAYIAFDRLTQNDFQSISMLARQNIMNDPNLSKDQKEKAVGKIKSLKYVDNKLFKFQLRSVQAFTDKELNFKFQILDQKNKETIEDVQRVLIRFMFQGPAVSSLYYWIIETKKPIDEKNFQESDLPLTCKITYPNGKMQIYEIKP
jgi:hypothetical protein